MQSILFGYVIIIGHWLITRVGRSGLLKKMLQQRLEGTRNTKYAALFLVIGLNLQPPLITAVFLFNKKWGNKDVKNATIGKNV